MEQSLSKRRILLVEHERSLPPEIRGLINDQPDLTCCSQVLGGLSIPAAVALEMPDLVLLGLSLNNGDAFELANSLRLEFPDLQVLVWSEGDETLYAEQALRAGARGYIMREETAEEMLTAIRTILSGKIYLSHAMSVMLVQRVLKPGSSRAPKTAQD